MNFISGEPAGGSEAAAKGLAARSTTQLGRILQSGEAMWGNPQIDAIPDIVGGELRGELEHALPHATFRKLTRISHAHALSCVFQCFNAYSTCC